MLAELLKIMSKHFIGLANLRSGAMQLPNIILAKCTERLVVPHEIIRKPHFGIKKLLRKGMKTLKLLFGI